MADVADVTDVADVADVTDVTDVADVTEFDFLIFQCLFCQNVCEVIAIRGIVGKSGILHPIKFW